MRHCYKEHKRIVSTPPCIVEYAVCVRACRSLHKRVMFDVLRKLETRLKSNCA